MKAPATNGQRGRDAEMSEMHDYKNKREFSRVSPRLDVVLATEARTIRSGQIQDVSMNGLFCVCDNPFPEGTGCRVTLLLGGPEGPVRIETSGTVTRATESGNGVEFSGIGVDDYHHLRNLVLHNAADPNLAEQEIKGHLGLKSR